MQLLADTHSFLWYVEGSPLLSPTAKTPIGAPTNDVYLSMASIWEIAIKVSVGKLPLAQPLDVFLPTQLHLHQPHLLAITLDHLDRVAVLPFHHRDPFDRFLIAQSLVETLPIVSRDPHFDPYGVQRLW